MKNFILFICGMLVSFQLHAQDIGYSLKKSYLIDSSEIVTVENLKVANFIPYQYDLHLGFQSKPVWLKFNIKPIEISNSDKLVLPFGDSQIILRMGPYQLDSIELYEPQGANWLVQKTGDREHVTNRICPDDTHCMALSSPPDREITVFLKVSQRGVFSVRAEVLPLKSLAPAVANGTARNSASIAIAGSLLFMALVLLMIERNFLLLTFCCFQGVVVIFILSTTGRIQFLLPSSTPYFLDNLTHHMFNLRVLMFILLGWATLSQYKPNNRYKYMVFALVTLLLLNNIFIQIGKIQWFILLYLLASGVNLFVQYYGIYSTTNIPSKIRILLIVAYLLYFFILVSALLVIFGQLMPLATANFINSFADWRTNGGPAGIIIFLIVIIQQAERKLATSQVIGKLSLEAAKSQANEEKLTERQTLIDILTHELKNPLGTIRFALASLKKQSTVDNDALARVSRIDRSVERMNELIEHVAHSNKIDRFVMTDAKESVDAMELIDELTSDHYSDGRFNIEIEEGASFFTHRRMLYVVLENLISNACKYDNRQAPISIIVSLQASVILIEITNSIDPHIRPDENKLFTRYYRHDGVQSLPGMGIGLSLVEAAAEKIDVKVSCHTEPELVSFKVEVPL